MTSVDLSLSSGAEIFIEERSASELLNTRGGHGEQVAASGISVWNPAFDVTPASLISGIIIEKVTFSLSETYSYHVFVHLSHICLCINIVRVSSQRLEMILLISRVLCRRLLATTDNTELYTLS